MESIAHLMAHLPSDYEKDCFDKGVIVRKRGVSCPADLMMLAMFHLQNGCSLLEISEVARITKLGNMSDVAFMKRFEKCAPWFIGINKKIMSESLVDYIKPAWVGKRSVIAIDASDICEKSRSKRIFRLHYALDIFNMASVEHSITTNKTGESLSNFKLTPGQLIVADRAYSTIKNIKHCEDAGAEYILRLRKNSFTLKDEQNNKIDMASLLRNLDEDEILDINAFATNIEGERIAVRVCAKRKTPEAIAKTQKKLKRKESKNQRAITDETKAFNEYIVLASNLDATAQAIDILELYRLRWQIEIYFKRLKSILDYGQMPKRRHDSIIAWLNGKLMIALLIEAVIAKASFSPKENNITQHLA